MLFLQPMPMDEVAAANRPVAAEVYTMKVCRTHTAPAWNGMLLAQAPGTPGSPSPNPGSGSLLEPPGSPAAETPVPPPRPNNVNNGTPGRRSTTGGTPNDPGRDTTREPVSRLSRCALTRPDAGDAQPDQHTAADRRHQGAGCARAHRHGRHLGPDAVAAQPDACAEQR